MILLNQAALRPSAVAIGFGSHQAGGSELVAFIQIDQAHALGGPAAFADGAGIEARDLALLGNEHDFGFLGHAEHAHHFAIALRRLHVNHALAGARLLAILGDGGAFAVALLGNREDEFLLAHNFHAHDVVTLVQIHAVDAVGGAAHVSHVGLGEAD